MSILRADSIRDRAGTGAPNFPNGATVTGVVTATSFSGALTGNADTATSATSATTATNAQGLTGTPNITVGTVTGTDATFSGNLTVQGTTTTIDTAVTDVDSLVVDGNVGIGTTIPNTYNNYNTLTINGNSGGELDFERQGVLHADIFANDSAYYITTRVNDLPIVFSTTNSGATHAERVKITGGGTAIFKAGLAEKSNRVTGSLGSNPNNSITDGNIIFFNGYNESGNLTINFTDIHANLGVHECCSFTVIISPNGSGVITTVTIDGQTPADGLKWSGGSAPSAGASGVDIYTFTIRKYDVANTAYSVFGAATNYA